ncbi:MAG: magnesium-translocating P-type ATPase [Acidobacteriota bacterium]|nr:magnesium-translocating P-type ATPase [Acidobacteriota bacterium]
MDNSAGISAPESPAGAPVLPPGLTTAEAAERLERYGPNDPTQLKARSLLAEALSLFSNPLVLILLVASGVAASVGEIVNATIIAVIVLLSAAINFWQTYRSRRAIDRLREQVGLTASVLRDGLWTELPRREIVPGDVIRVKGGDLVPADARLVEARFLNVQQASLTGESLPVEKSVTGPGEPLTPESPGAIFLGTSVVSGTATAVALATGRATVFGGIAARLVGRPVETEFERGLRGFGLLIMRVVVLLVLVVFLASAVLHHGWLDSLLFALALAVGLTPEFLPMITTVTLAQAAIHLSRERVIVKHLSAIQNLGSIDVLCSDKTGTLTSGEMSLDQRLDPFGRPAEAPFLYGYVNSLLETGIESPLDKAILAREQPSVVSVFHKLAEIPFDFERRRISIVVSKEGERLLIVKGAPESVLPLCSRLLADAAEQPMDDAARSRCTQTYHEKSESGLRVLAVALRNVPEKLSYSPDEETDLTLIGFLTFLDPPLEDAAETLEKLRRDGVRLMVLTGDNQRVAGHVCAEVGLDTEQMMLGEEIDRETDPALGALAEQTDVFARVSPAQKTRILMVLRRRGHVVGFLGDGINDAPSLHAADVGISVSQATEAAKDAADVILLERSLSVLHDGILEGRRAFGNVLKYLLMGTSSNFGNMLSMAVASIVLPFLPMLPGQILLNNFLYDLAQITIPSDNVDPSFMRKPRRWDISLVRNFMVGIGPVSSIFDFLTFGALLFWLHTSEPQFHTGWFVESLATQTLVLFIIRTAGNPLRSRPSTPLIATVLAIVTIGLLLPVSPLATMLGFARLSPAFYAFLTAVTAVYLLSVEVAKGFLLRRFLR